MRWCPAGRGRREVVRGGVQGVVGHGQGVEHDVRRPVIQRAHGLGDELSAGRQDLYRSFPARSFPGRAGGRVGVMRETVEVNDARRNLLITCNYRLCV
jgi:hypothetical protein